MKNQQENRQIEFANVLLETKAKRVLRFQRQHSRLLVNLRVAKPVAVSAIDVAAGRQLDENERKRTRRCLQCRRTAERYLWCDGSDLGARHDFGLYTKSGTVRPWETDITPSPGDAKIVAPASRKYGDASVRIAIRSDCDSNAACTSPHPDMSPRLEASASETSTSRLQPKQPERKGRGRNPPRSFTTRREKRSRRRYRLKPSSPAVIVAGVEAAEIAIIPAQLLERSAHGRGLVGLSAVLDDRVDRGVRRFQGDRRFGSRRLGVRARQAQHHGRGKPDAKRRQALAKALPGQPAVVQLPGDVTNFADV